MEQVDNIGKITIIKDDKEVECEILISFDCEELGKSYLAFTDYSFDEDGRQNIYFASYYPDVDYENLEYNKLEPVTSPQEIEMLREILDNIEKEAQK